MWDLSFTTQPGMLSNKNQYLFLEKRKKHDGQLRKTSS